MKKTKLMVTVLVCGGLLAGLLANPQGALAAPFKMEFNNTTVLAISGVAIVALVATAIVTHDQYLKSKAKQKQKVLDASGIKTDYKVKSKEEMKKELEQMRQEGN